MPKQTLQKNKTAAITHCVKDAGVYKFPLSSECNNTTGVRTRLLRGHSPALLQLRLFEAPDFSRSLGFSNGELAQYLDVSNCTCMFHLLIDSIKYNRKKWTPK